MKSDYWTLDNREVVISKDEMDTLILLLANPLSDEMCDSEGDDGYGTPWVCNRPFNHEGPHMASHQDVCAVWTDDEVQPEKPHLLALKK